MTKNSKPKYNTPAFKQCLKAANILLEPSNDAVVLLDHNSLPFNASSITDHARPLLTAAEIFQGAQDDRPRGTENTVIRHAERWFPTPHLLPGRCTNREYIICHADARWSKCDPFKNMHNIIPRPDYVSGFRSAAFNGTQLYKMDIHFARGKVTPFAPSPDVYWPFLMVECKKPRGKMGAADDANMLSSSIMIKELVKLYERSDADIEIEGTVLGFSISHDHDNIIIFSHYAEISTANEVIYRRRRELTYSICSSRGEHAIRAHQFVAWIYREWQPTHLEWIKKAIDGLPNTLDRRLRIRSIRRKTTTLPGSWPMDELVEETSPIPTTEEVWYPCSDTGLTIVQEHPYERDSTATPEFTPLRAEPALEFSGGHCLIKTFGNMVLPFLTRKRKWEADL